MTTKGSNHLQRSGGAGDSVSECVSQQSEDLLMVQRKTHAGYSGTCFWKVGSSLQYSLYSHFTLKCKFI